MHELPVINTIHSVILKHAVTHQVKKVTAIHLQVGALSDLEDEWMQTYFDYVSRGGIAEGAKLMIQRVPAKMQCGDCSTTYEMDLKGGGKPSCPECNSASCSLVSGREYHIKNMEAL